MDDMMWFWGWWTLTVGLVVWQIGRALLNAKLVLGFPVIAGVMWLYFYGLLPFGLARSESVPPTILPVAQFLPFAAYVSLLLGWYVRLNQRSAGRRSQTPAALDLERLSTAGVALAFVGLAGYVSFHASERAYTETSAYWYLLYDLCYPGISVCVVAMTIAPSSSTRQNLFLAAALVAPVIFLQLLNARRGPTFVAVIAITYSYLLVRPRLPRPAVILGILGASGIVMLVLVSARSVVYHDGTWGEALSTVSFADKIEDRITSRTADNEYYNHCMFLEANLRTGLYQYGTTHLNGLLNWIPRQIWPDKPPRGQGFFPSALYEIKSGPNINLGHGGASGGVEDTFDNYWFFFPVFWLLTGYGTAAIFVRAFRENNLHWKMRYVGVLCAAHWFIAQSITEAFVPAMIFQGCYFVAFRYAAIPGGSETREMPEEKEDEEEEVES